MKRKFFAFDMPIETFHRLPSPLLVFWKNSQSVYYGSNDLQAYLTGSESGQVAGKMDYEWMPKEDAENLIKNDQQILDNHLTRSFLEVVNFRGAKHSLSCLSIKTILKNSANQTEGIFGFSFILNENNLSQPKKIFNKYTLSKAINFPILLLPSLCQSKLTQKEKECIYELAKGKSAKQIAHALRNSPRTIETHLQNIKQKLGCHTRAQIIEKAFEEGSVF